MDIEKIQGKFIYKIFKADSGFSVYRFELYDLNAKNIIVSGYLPDIEMDILYNLNGNYVEHPKYGMQFKIDYFERVKPNDYDSVVRYLSGPNFEGIGKKFASIIVDYFGDDCLDIITENPELLNEVPKMTLKRKNSIIDGLKKADDNSEKIIKYFTIHGLGIRNIMRIERAYGSEAIEKISKNPYRMVSELSGIGFNTCDKLAKSIGFELDHPQRIEACLVSLVMEKSMANGDTYVLLDELELALAKRLNGLSYDFDNVLKNCVLDRRLYLEENKCYHITQFNAEEFIAQFLQEFPYEQLNQVNETELSDTINQLQDKFNISYDDHQIEAIKTLYKNDFMILTGGPGTGKTTVVKAMVECYKKVYPNNTIVCIAPTGRAAKRLSELCDTTSYTIHSILKWDLETNTFGMNSENPILYDLLIIDEFSMVDNYLFYSLLLASKYVKKICIIGDEDQLPSVSCGSLLRDLIQSNMYPIVRLTKIFRQKDGNDIINLAHDIRNVDVDFTRYENDVKFIQGVMYDIKDIIVNVVKAALDKGYLISDIQVLASMYNGIAGIDRLNRSLQDTFNPKTELVREAKIGYKIFRENDKILQLKNQPDDDVYNGDIGVLIEIIYPKEDHNNQLRLIVDFDGIFVEYTQETFQNITLAYCVSVHKSQGSEYPIIIMPVVFEQKIMLQRKLLYTAVTRAKKSLILIGDINAFEFGIKNNDFHERKSTLQQRLKHNYFE